SILVRTGNSPNHSLSVRASISASLSGSHSCAAGWALSKPLKASALITTGQDRDSGLSPSPCHFQTPSTLVFTVASSASASPNSLLCARKPSATPLSFDCTKDSSAVSWATLRMARSRSSSIRLLLPASNLRSQSRLVISGLAEYSSTSHALYRASRAGVLSVAILTTLRAQQHVVRFKGSCHSEVTLRLVLKLLIQDLLQILAIQDL